MKELHIYLFTPDYDESVLTDYISTAIMLNQSDDDVIKTTQVNFLSFDYKRRLFVHISESEVHEITLGNCDGTDKEIREAHNLEKMLIAGSFSWFK